MRAVASFLALSKDDRRLLLKALATLIFVRFVLGVVAAGWLRAWSAHLGSGARPVERIAWAVSACARRVPGATCLVSAFALQRLLSSEGHPSELHIGVARRADRLAAHAWIVCQGSILIGESEAGGYAPLVTWRVDHTAAEQASSDCA
jgi:hypothetical protein